MSSPFHDLLKHNFSHAKRLQKLITPLTQHVGVDQFWQYSISENGAFTTFGTDPENASYHYEGGGFKDNVFLSHPDSFSNGYIFLQDDPNWDRIYNEMLRKFPMHHGLIVMQKDVSGTMDAFCMASTKKIPGIHSTYMNKRDLIQRFIAYWKENTKSLSDIVRNDAVNIAALKGFERFTQLEKSPYLYRTADSRQFLYDIGVDHHLLKIEEGLSERERQVLKLCAEGRTAASAGKCLHLSKRTVEHYLSILKEKFAVSSKEELIAIGNWLKKNGLGISTQ